MQIRSDIGAAALSQFQSETIAQKLFLIFLSTNRSQKTMKNNITLTGSSSFPFHILETCRCCMTYFIFSKAGRAVHPAFMLKAKINMSRFVRKKSTYQCNLLKAKMN